MITEKQARTIVRLTNAWVKAAQDHAVQHNSETSLAYDATHDSLVMYLDGITDYNAKEET